MMFIGFKHLHMMCAALSICGFLLRSYWAFVGSHRLQARWVKTLPHIVDTLLLLTAIGMLVIWQVSPFLLPWVTAKIVALLVYILFGMAVLKWAKNNRQRAVYFAGAVLAVAYIVAVAFTKNPVFFVNGV